MKKYLAYSVCLVFIISAGFVFAEIKSLVKEYTYQASELDSKTSCRAIALEQVKRELLEELGTYVESTTVVQDAQIEKDEIKTLSAGVVQTKILDEKWDGKSFWLKAEVSADPDEVAASIEKLKNDQKLAEELAESQAEKEDALKEVDRLKAELAQSNADKEKLAQYNQAVNQLQASDSFQQGTAMTVAGDYEGATKAYDRVIYLRPEDPKAYFGRSIVYIYLGNYQRATQDLNRAMVIRPANTNAYFQRASAYKSIREARLIKEAYRGRQFPGQPYRPVVPVPRHDPLQRFLDNKQTQHNLVKVNPFQPRPVIKKDGRQVPLRALEQRRERPAVGQPVKPDVRKGTTIYPSSGGQNRQLLQQRRDEQRRRELDEKQKARYYKGKERPIVGQPRREAYPPKKELQKVQQQKVVKKTKQQEKDEELEKASRRRQ
jgi:tetratricopeptide (TPR) repeat protein